MGHAADPALALIQAYRRHERLAAAPGAGPSDAEAAYAVQGAVWRTMVGEERSTVWKVGAASLDAEPLAAPMFPRHVAGTPAAFLRKGFFSLGVEAEIAFRFGRDLPARPKPYTRAEILDAIAAAYVAMELVDTRLADAQGAGPFWRLADNLLNGGFVLGDELPGWRAVDFAALTAAVRVDGREIAKTSGGPPLGDLLHCLPWWLGHVGGAREGDTVTTGAWNGMHPVALPASVVVEFLSGGERLGRAEVRVD